MAAASPRYLRRHNDEDEYMPKRMSTSTHNAQMDQSSLFVTGLREKRLVFLIVWLALLFLFAIIILICNLMLISVLRMTHRGIRNVQFHGYANPRTGERETVVYFAGDHIDLGHVVVESGQVYGRKGQTMNVEGSRVVISGGPNTTQFSLNDGICRFDSQENFLIRNNRDGRTMFSALHPMVDLDHRIKRVSAQSIVTNKIRSPVKQDLTIAAQDINLRGNEGIRVESRRFIANSTTAIRLKTSADGSIHLSGRRIKLGSEANPLPLSPSPALTASIDAFRVCVCATARPKLFIVKGNKPCKAPASICK